jgi:hypothetical protein
MYKQVDLAMILTMWIWEHRDGLFHGLITGMNGSFVAYCPLPIGYLKHNAVPKKRPALERAGRC